MGKSNTFRTPSILETIEGQPFFEFRLRFQGRGRLVSIIAEKKLQPRLFGGRDMRPGVLFGGAGVAPPDGLGNHDMLLAGRLGPARHP